MIFFVSKHVVSLCPSWTTTNHFIVEKSSIFSTAFQHYSVECCKDHCLWKFSLQECADAHTWYKGQSQQQSREWLRTTIQACMNSATDHVALRSHGKSLCHQAFKLLYGFSNNKFDLALADARRIGCLVTHGNLGNHNAEKLGRKFIIHTWLEEFLAVNGDTDPVSGNIHIPAYLNKHHLFEQFLEDSKISGTVTSLFPSYSSFYNYFHQHFSHVKFLKHTRLGRCRFCMEFQQRRKSLKTPQELIDFKEATHQHHLLHSTERTLYESRCSRATLHPEDFLSLIVDCPKGYEVPHVQPVTKDSWRANKIEVDAVGAICHSTSIRQYYFHLPIWVKGPNLIITVLYLHLFTCLTQLKSQSMLSYL
jgi:hypothetical protein